MKSLPTSADSTHVVDQRAPLLRVARRAGVDALPRSQDDQLAALEALDDAGIPGVAFQASPDAAAALCNRGSGLEEEKGAGASNNETLSEWSLFRTH